MRILILQFLHDGQRRPVPRFDPNLGTLITLLQQRDHEISLCAVERFDITKVKTELARTLPQLIYADISCVCVDIARRTLQYIQEHEFLPVVAGGNYSAVDPKGCLSLPAVRAAAIGESDASLVTYLERMKDPAVGQVVSGVWLRDEQGLSRPGMPALVEDLDSLPLPERDLFNYAECVRKTGEIEIAVGRGCPQTCGYCVNDWVEALYDEDAGTWVRRRSPGNVMDEIELLCGRYERVRSVRFLDHAFALANDWLSAFLDMYPSRCSLPFRCHLRANSTDAELVTRLSDAGCQLADIELISGSDFIRNEIFDMDLNEEQIRSAFDLLEAAGIRTRVIVYLGSPYESEASLDETRELLRSLKPDAVDVRAYYPWPGTRARETAEENGWIHPRGEEQYHQRLCGINMPACRPEIVSAFMKRLRHEFPAFPGEPWWRRLSLPRFGR